jgi:uncharacterized damage-inducible protein DinB
LGVKGRAAARLGRAAWYVAAFRAGNRCGFHATLGLLDTATDPATYAMKEQLLTLADYHVWAFRVLDEALLPIADADYAADAGLFFGSIHATLNHLLLGDRVWFGRVTGEPYEVAGLDVELEAERTALSRALDVQARRWRPWLEGLDDATLAADLHYTNLSGTAFRNPLAMIVLHVFNHGTHHRGQISAAVTRAGHAAPEMDLIWYLRAGGAPPPAV